jgi:hypothetical protein
MSLLLPSPKLVSADQDTTTPGMPAMTLDWGEAGNLERLWDMPEGVNLVGPPPRRFGCRIERVDADLYSVHVVWDRSRLSWPALRRVQLLGSALVPLLQATGADLNSLLNQPHRDVGVRLTRAV